MSQVPTLQLSGQLFYFQETNLRLFLVSLQGLGLKWLSYLTWVLWYLWWHINWAVPLKKRKANVTIGTAVFAGFWKLVSFGQKSLRYLFTHQNVSNTNWIALSPFCMHVSMSVSTCAVAFKLFSLKKTWYLNCNSLCLDVRSNVGRWESNGDKISKMFPWRQQSFPPISCIIDYFYSNQPALITS